MLTESTKDQIRKSLKAVAARLPGFRSRDGQRLLIAEVAKTFGRCPDPVPEGQSPPARPETGTTILCAQGGTGVGKSLAYALPGAILARQKGMKLIISTATVALQEQLTRKDLPVFFDAAELPLTVELAKGRSRFVCHLRLQQVLRALRQNNLFDAEADSDASGPQDDATRTAVEALAADYDSGKWNGDRDLRHGLDDALWRTLTTDRHGCLGRNCSSFKQCAQVDAKKRLKAADIVVANHDLILADLAMGGGKILPAPERCLYIFDEAHHLPAKAIESFAAGHLVGGARTQMERLKPFASTLTQALGPSFIADAKAIVDSAEAVRRALEDAFDFFDCLVQLKPTEKQPRPRTAFQDSCIPEELICAGEAIRAGAADLATRVGRALELLGEELQRAGARKPLFERLVADAGFHAGRLEEIAATWHLFLEVPPAEQPPIAKWIETLTVRGRTDFRVCASPVRAAAQLRRQLWEKAGGAVLTSATLTTLGRFDDFLCQSGLDRYPRVSCIEVQSPFDYYRQGTLEIPSMSALPADYRGHTKEVGDWLAARIGEMPVDGMLVLFTSKQQMSDVAAQLPKAARDRVLVQGDASKSEILASHKARVDRGEPSVIFGLESFSEGVDLARGYCTRVVITKLPFDVPDDPVLKSLSDWIERCGRKPFMEVWVPTAARKLEQRAGRLIRTETDTGTVSVLDRRLWQTAYGKTMLRGMPPFRLVVSGQEVRL